MHKGRRCSRGNALARAPVAGGVRIDKMLQLCGLVSMQVVTMVTVVPVCVATFFRDTVPGPTEGSQKGEFISVNIFFKVSPVVGIRVVG